MNQRHAIALCFSAFLREGRAVGGCDHLEPGRVQRLSLRQSGETLCPAGGPQAIETPPVRSALGLKAEGVMNSRREELGKSEADLGMIWFTETGRLRDH